MARRTRQRTGTQAHHRHTGATPRTVGRAEQPPGTLAGARSGPRSGLRNCPCTEHCARHRPRSAAAQTLVLHASLAASLGWSTRLAVAQRALRRVIKQSL
eukprot:7380572-Alexandrium_andersonii.AAC.1